MAKQQTKDKAFQWSDSEAKILIVICREYHKRNGVDTHFNWGEIAEKFEKKTGRKVSAPVAKNKFDYMKTVWKTWSDLRFRETGVGWNETAHKIEASEEWWERKLAESDKYKRFRRKPVDRELSELWDSVFNSICATGKHCVSANMDKNHLETETQSQTQAGFVDPSSFEYNMGSECSGDDEGFVEPVGISLTQEAPLPCAEESPSLGKRSTATGNAQPMQKRRKKRSSAAAQYKECMASIENTNERFLSILEGEVGSNGCTSKDRGYDLDDAINIIDRLVKEGAMTVASGLWCYAVDELNNDISRRLFMTLKTDQEKLAWLEYKFQKQA